MANVKKIALIAGETSGDQLGGWLIEALKKQASPVFIGLGGPRMMAQGLTSLFPMEEISLIGFTEVLPHYKMIKRRIAEMVAYLEAEKPDVIITIDSMGFNHRVIHALRENGKIRPRLIHYVAPSVWAYRPKRAGILAGIYDELFCLLPFEPPYFEAVGLKTHYIGHEIAWFWKDKGDGPAFRARHGIAPQTPLLALFPGSRRGELKRLLPLFRTTVAQLKAAVPDLELLVQVPDYLKPQLEAEVARWPVKTHLLPSSTEKKDVFAAATAGLAKSGTIGLECALAGLPSVITYKVNPITHKILMRIIKIQYANLANLLAGRMIIPELIQKNATPEKITAALVPLLTDETTRAGQRAELQNVAAQLGATDAQSPSDKAAALILQPATN